MVFEGCRSLREYEEGVCGCMSAERSGLFRKCRVFIEKEGICRVLSLLKEEECLLIGVCKSGENFNYGFPFIYKVHSQTARIVEGNPWSTKSRKQVCFGFSVYSSLVHLLFTWCMHSIYNTFNGWTKRDWYYLPVIYRYL